MPTCLAARQASFLWDWHPANANATRFDRVSIDGCIALRSHTFSSPARLIERTRGGGGGIGGMGALGETDRCRAGEAATTHASRIDERRTEDEDRGAVHTTITTSSP